MIYRIGKKLILLVPCALFLMSSFAQDPKKKTIEITSTFKPVLREAVKINFDAVPPLADTTRPRLTYNIPVQNLMFAYQPAELKPVALQVDSLTAWEYSNYIKAGIGNVHQPFIQAGFSFGNSTNSYFNLFANHYSSKGELDFQKNNHTSIGIAGTVRTIKNHEWNGRIGFKSEDYYFYGYQPKTLSFSKEQLRQRFQTYEGKVHFRNYAPTEFNLLYNPNLSVSVFSNNQEPRGQETNSVLNLPLEKSFGETFGFKLGLTADLTGYKPGGDLTNNGMINNNIYLISPALLYKTPRMYIHGGIIPSWDRGEFTLMPNVMVDFTVPDQPFTVQVGWIGYYNKGSYQRFAEINPWIAQPDSILLNTRVQERYVGIKGSAGNHLTYSGKLGFNIYKNMPLFVNDTVDGKTFLTVFEPSMEALHLHAEVGYSWGEAFSVSAKLDFNQYSKLEREKKAWGLLPLEFTGSLKWRLLKDLWLRSDIFAWDGAQYRGKNLDNYKGDAAFDWSAGLEFKITRQFNLWVQMNNIFNNKYERWNQYQAYGFNILGGIVYSFGQK